MLVAETIHVFAVETGVEGVVARGDGALMDLVAAGGVLNLLKRCEYGQLLSLCIWGMCRLQGQWGERGPSRPYPEIDI